MDILVILVKSAFRFDMIPAIRRLGFPSSIVAFYRVDTKQTSGGACGGGKRARLSIIADDGGSLVRINDL